MPQDDESQNVAANRMYWESDASVAEIARRLGVSRRALYDAVQPAPAGERCPDCGTDVVFRTRTARMLGEAECTGCGQEHEIEALRQAMAETEPTDAAAAPSSVRTAPDATDAMNAPGTMDEEHEVSEAGLPTGDSEEEDAAGESSDWGYPPVEEPETHTEESTADMEEEESPAATPRDEPHGSAADAAPRDAPPIEPDDLDPDWLQMEAEGFDDAERDMWQDDRVVLLGFVALTGAVIGAIAIWLGSRR